jgi:hypothetical protein
LRREQGVSKVHSSKERLKRRPNPPVLEVDGKAGTGLASPGERGKFASNKRVTHQPMARKDSFPRFPDNTTTIIAKYIPSGGWIVLYFGPNEELSSSSSLRPRPASTVRTIPSFFMRKWSVERFIPKRLAAPLGPPTIHLVCFKVARM